MELERRKRTPVHFQESAGRFGEWLNMKNKESKVTSSVLEPWGHKNDGSPQKLGSWEESRVTFILGLETCLFKKQKVLYFE